MSTGAGPIAAPPSGALTQAQLADLATVLATYLGRGNTAWLAETMLGNDAVRNVGNDVEDPEVFARKIIDALVAAGKLSDAITLLRRGEPNGKLSFFLNAIVRGDLLSSAQQAFLNDYEPFLSSAQFLERFPRVSRTICAIGLGDPWYDIRGSGFLVGPDLVMTNAHVILPFLKDGNLEEGASGDEIICFFDYLSEPAPDVPPADGRHAFDAVSAKTNGWLVHGRLPLPNEGEPHCDAQANDRYDYVVIRLSRKVGNLPSRVSGGPPRGWLPLPANVAIYAPQKRVIVYQHPGKSAQQFDIGEYVDRDITGTRVRYKVNTAKGSSGGAAVDTEGQLFALHTAAVQPPATKLNQGVQINLITQDVLAHVPEVATLPAPTEVPFWSLVDDLADPRPVIGRDVFRENVQDLHRRRDGVPRVVALWGPPGCGLRYSVKLLRRTLGPEPRVVEFSADNLSTFTAERFLIKLAKSLGFANFTAQSIPQPNATENLPRWLRIDLPDWLAKALEEEAKREPARYPAWVVLHTAVEDFFWADKLNDLVAALAGAHDPGQNAIAMPHLRFLFLASTLDSVPPLPGVQRIDEDLSSYATHAEDYLECLRRALYALDKSANLGSPLFYQADANVAVNGFQPLERRKVLSERVRALVQAARTLV